MVRSLVSGPGGPEFDTYYNPNFFSKEFAALKFAVMGVFLEFLISRMAVSDWSKMIARKCNHGTLLEKGVMSHCSNKLSRFKINKYL